MTDVDAIALEATYRIENAFAVKRGKGGYVQRRAAVQIIIADTIRALSPPEPTARHEMFMAGMHALEVAIECDDPKRELALRIKDLIAEAKAFRPLPLQDGAVTQDKRGTP